jgi:hypothetical protein
VKREFYILENPSYLNGSFGSRRLIRNHNLNEHLVFALGIRGSDSVLGSVRSLQRSDGNLGEVVDIINGHTFVIPGGK